MQGRLPRKIVSIARPYARELLYLESTGTQWIDLGIDYGPTNYNRIRLVVDGCFTDTSAQYSVHGCGNGQAACYVGVEYNKLSHGNGQGVSTSTLVYTAGKRAVFDLDMSAEKYSVTGFSDMTFSRQMPTTTLNLLLFACDTGIYTEAIVYGAKVYDNGTLVRDCIPVMDHQGVACLYDRVTETLLYNAGSGSFGYGEIASLPAGYTQLAYIEANGTQLIDSGITPTSNTVIELKAASTNGNFYAARTGTSRYGIYLVQTGRIDIAFGSTGYIGSVLTGLTEPVTMRMENGQVTANGSTYTFSTQGSFTASGTLTLFGSDSSACPGGRLYHCRIYEGSTLVRELVPCINAAGSIGLYDTVGKQFYGNAGTGSFIAGGAA